MKPRLTPQVVIGLVIIAAGVIFTLDNLGIIYAPDYLIYWPIALVIVGAMKVWGARRDGHGWFAGLVFLGIGSWMLVKRVAYITIDARELVPLFLIFIGGFMVWRGFFGRGGPRGDAADGMTRFSALAILGGASRRSNAPAFEGGDLTAIMGGCEIDLREASIAPNTEAVIDIFAFWGGVDLKVPEDWTVINRVVPLMGGVDDRTHTPIASAPSKRLVVRGIVIMGGVGIRNRSRRDERRDERRDGRDLGASLSAAREDLRDAAREVREQIRDETRGS
jgi:hypothetical protein